MKNSRPFMLIQTITRVLVGADLSAIRLAKLVIRMVQHIEQITQRPALLLTEAPRY